MRRKNDLRDALEPRRMRPGVRWGGVTVLALIFVAGFLIGAWWANPLRLPTVWECGGDQLVGTLLTDDDALNVPGRLILAWTAGGNKKLISRDLFEICAEVPTNNK